MFTEEEVKAAKATRDEIITQDIATLKAIYMAGEICMWDEMTNKPEVKQSAQTPVLPSFALQSEDFYEFVKKNLGEDTPDVNQINQ